MFSFRVKNRVGVIRRGTHGRSDSIILSQRQKCGPENPLILKPFSPAMGIKAFGRLALPAADRIDGLERRDHLERPDRCETGVRPGSRRAAANAL